MDNKKIVKKVVVICAACGLSYSTVMGELGEIYEGKAMKEHAQAHYHYQYLGTTAHMAIGTSASSAAISGDTLGGFSLGIQVGEEISKGAEEPILCPCFGHQEKRDI